ncbi:uncharacterized protein PHALS_11112 [Plasmopara halstedii]|uniref:Uncharacterized protein n=1 Tax=Plasmopara halstedii TaxID=4781 RepID=A0A0P1AIC6_PLAHL|nr:uncharacterized protein PHALS_11112 [Plasmopara halstedii]CEG40938.1 hypothetical protein PHALS_11112 [Plasmopara halstedii]|eukprot:XP_024577307.1 hypothetical protein PHALS_11112 [Plasmopara halstedii]
MTLLTIASAVDLSGPDAQQWTQPESVRWPALHFHINVKQDAMRVYGLSNFDMYAKAIVLDKNVLYDVYAAITDVNNDIVLNYTLVNGVAYFATTSIVSFSASKTSRLSKVCFDSELSKLPDVNLIVAAVNDVKPANISTCTTGPSFTTTMKGIDYSVCVSTTGFTFQGSELDVSVEYMENPINIQLPTMNSSAKKCLSSASSTPITVLGHALLTTELLSSDNTRRLSAETHMSFISKRLPECSCKSTPRPCIFVHGQGSRVEMPENLDSFPHYWGDLTGHAPCCSSIKYARLQTYINAWTDASLQQRVCARVLAVSNTSTENLIADTIVVTHSMGNLMFAGALANKRCKLDSSSTWVGMSGPMKGSMASDYVQDTCAGNTSALIKNLAEVLYGCPPPGALLSLAYEGGKYCSKELSSAYKAAQKVYREQVYALSCGKSYSGLWSRYQSRFWMLANLIPHKSKQNDGLVEFQSCAAGLPESKFGNSYLDRFYGNTLNHLDMQFKSGDSPLYTSKMPLKWFECLL